MKQEKIGTLYVVATPIGNLEDITLRALRILKEVDCVLCEDKRVTAKLLNRYQIKTKLISFHKFNESKSIADIVSLISSGKNIALVSDGGTPLISDPGSNLISVLIKNNIKIFSIPGPSALTSAFAISPFVGNEFLFLGFLPSQKSKREEIISSLKERSKVAILFVAPHDLNKYLLEIQSFYSDIEVSYARELTKIYEEHWLGKINNLIELVEKKKLKGEIVLFLYFNNAPLVSLDSDVIVNEMKSYISSGSSLKDASKIIAKKVNLSSKSLYNLYLKAKSCKP